jgi:ABC-type Na+ efflux pump permease subunit
MNRRGMLALVRRDLSIVRRSGPLVAPIYILPIVMSVLVPGLIGILPRLVGDLSADTEVARLIARLPAGMRQDLSGLNDDQAMVTLLTVQLLAPLFLLLPFMVSNVIAADSFAGERERKTLESLLYTPLTDRELFLAKTITAWIPSLVVTALSFIANTIVVNAAAWPTMQRIFFPNLMWIVLVVWVAPAVAALGLGAMVLVSMRVRGVQESIQLSGLFVLPIIVLVIAQVRGVMMLGTRNLMIAGLVLWVVSGVVLWYGARSFRRESLIARV